MASQAYYTWDDAGRPYTLARPIAELKQWCADNHVQFLGDIGNQEHLEHVPPQDHTPYSATAWPLALPGYIVTAIDFSSAGGLGYAIENLATQGQLPWLKYMNHDGRHLDVRTGWAVQGSSDQHVHLSIRTDWLDKSIGDFDPLQLGDAMILRYGMQDIDTDAGGEICRLQADLKLLDPNALPDHGIDGGYGDETAKWVSILVTGGYGKVFGGKARSHLDQLLREKYAGEDAMPATLTLAIPAHNVTAQVVN